MGGAHCALHQRPRTNPLFSLCIYRALTYLQGKTNMLGRLMLGIILNLFHNQETGRSNVSLLGVDSLWGNCTFIQADWGS